MRLENVLFCYNRHLDTNFCDAAHTHGMFLFYVDIEVSCYGYEGIDAVKRALFAGLELSTEEMPIKVRKNSPRNVAISIAQDLVSILNLRPKVAFFFSNIHEL